MSFNNSKKGIPMSVGSKISKSIEQQNEYLLNYIHKLEFLILQSQKERADIAFKFKKIVSHLVLELSRVNKMDAKAYRTLKGIVISPSEDSTDSTQPQSLASERDEKDFLQETLDLSSK
mmetsp:Transcript_4173/g.5096  ORF Transcript_4173/g.5096 Transcript_4173/m.5096 type:complete len:119 (-) Transcript_4173:611-967(-)